MLTRGEIRDRIVRIAEAEIGPGRVGDYNESCGLPRNTRAQWCGIFALWALHEAGVGSDVKWRVGLGFVEPQRLPRTTRPQPGDIAYFHSPFQHHAIVEKLDRGILTTIDGNQPDVKRRTRSAPSGVVYYSIEPLLERLELRDTEPAPAPTVPPSEPPWTVIRRNDYGPKVVLWQERAKEFLGTGTWFTRSWARKGRADGDFGPETEAATREVQRRALLPQSGEVDRATWDAARVR